MPMEVTVHSGDGEGEGVQVQAQVVDQRWDQRAGGLYGQAQWCLTSSSLPRASTDPRAGRVWLTYGEIMQEPGRIVALSGWMAQHGPPMLVQGRHYCRCGQGFIDDDAWQAHTRTCVQAEGGGCTDNATSEGWNELAANDSHTRPLRATTTPADGTYSSPEPEESGAAGHSLGSRNEPGRGALNQQVDTNSCEANGRVPWYLHANDWTVQNGGHHNLRKMAAIEWPRVIERKIWMQMQEDILQVVDTVCTPAARAQKGAAWAIDFIDRTISMVAERTCGLREQVEKKAHRDEADAEAVLVAELRDQIRIMAKQWRREKRTKSRDERQLGVIRDMRKLRSLFVKMRRREARVAKEKLMQTAVEQCDQNRWKYASQVLAKWDSKAKSSQQPTFTKEQAEVYMDEMYKVPRGLNFRIPEGLERPPVPVVPYTLGYVSFSKFWSILKRKKGTASAAWRNVLYLPYKQMRQVALRLWICMTQLHAEIGGEDVETEPETVLSRSRAKDRARKAMPRYWRYLRQIYIMKAKPPTTPDVCRQLTMSEATPRLYMAGFMVGFMKFCTENNYIDPYQRGFQAEIAGVLEMGQLFYETVDGQRRLKREFGALFADIAGAYPGVPHDFLNMVLWWYHVPLWVRAWIMVYYENFLVAAESGEWQTKFIKWCMGLIQGCVASCQLFLLIFSFVMAYHKHLCAKHDVEIGLRVDGLAYPNKAMADDIAMVNRTFRMLQSATSLFEEALTVTQFTVREVKRGLLLKQSKCISLGFGIRVIDGKRTYGPMNPEIQVDGVTCAWMGEPDFTGDGTTLRAQMFKFLGRWMQHNLKEDKVLEATQTMWYEMLAAIDDDPCNGLQKVWITQNKALKVLEWPLMVNGLYKSHL